MLIIYFVCCNAKFFICFQINTYASIGLYAIQFQKLHDLNKGTFKGFLKSFWNFCLAYLQKCTKFFRVIRPFSIITNAIKACFAHQITFLLKIHNCRIVQCFVYFIGIISLIFQKLKQVMLNFRSYYWNSKRTCTSFF